MRTPATTWVASAVFCTAVGCSDDSSDATVQDDAGSPGSGGSPGEVPGETHPTQTLDRSRFTDVGTDGPLDYGVPEMWACRPDLDPNECDGDLSATEMRVDGSRVRVDTAIAEAPAFDCFYVYPTVLLDGTPQMVDFSEAGVALVSAPLLAQGARFASLCRMFAPMYRQVGLSGGTGLAAGNDPDLAVQDARDAFAYYLEHEHWNDGRRFVLIGHSPGTAMLTAVIKQDIDPDEHADVRERMISALLIGGGITVPEGEVVGGTFENVPVCTHAGDQGCVITYASYAADDPPGPGDLFGGTSVAGQRVACVNPAVMAGNDGTYSASYFHKAIENPSFNPDTPLPADLETPFAVYENLFRGECVGSGNVHYLEFSIEKQGDGDARTPPGRNSAVEALGFGLHLVDYLVPLGDLLLAVAAQAAR
jgi:hypothetical protein